MSRPVLMILISFCIQKVWAEKTLDVKKVSGSQSCMASGCHGGAGLDRGAYHIWKRYDPHFSASATLTNGRSKAMARQMGIENAAESKSCTICHSPASQVAQSEPAASRDVPKEDSGVSCASCHGPAEKWLLSHTRPDYPKDALARLGMRQLSSAYQRANQCVACHQNLSDELVEARHPALVFELDGMLVAEPKHWREEKGFSSVKTWLVGQAVALREASAQANRQPGDRRTAEIEAMKALLKATGSGWDESGKDLVSSADEYAKRISGAPMGDDQGRAILSRLLGERAPFQPGAFGAVARDYRSWAIGCYAERLVLAVDRLNQSQIASGKQKVIARDVLNDLFDAAKPPESFDDVTAHEFVIKLDRVAKSQVQTETGR